LAIATTKYVTDTALKLDQTTSQSIINGQPIQNTLTASELVSTDANKKFQSLAVATYPSLTELSYVKGLTSAVQAQINGKLADIVADTTPQLGGDLDVNGKNINLGAIPTSDGAYSGIIFSGTVDTNSVGVGCIMAIGSDGNFDEADADAIANAKMITLALETSTGTKKMMLQGFYCKTAWNWTVGADLFLSTTLGTITETAPSGTDDVVVILGTAMSADTIYFAPSKTYITRT
jgi:hypothetical protein